MIPALQAAFDQKPAPDFLDTLSEAEQRRLSADIVAARTRHQQSLDAAIEHGMRLVPALLRAPLKRILFP